MKLKDIPLENRPLERLEKNGLSSLSNAELLAIILKTGNKTENVIDMCNRLISKYSLEKLNKCSLKELQKIKGIGKSKSSQILALFEINKRYNSKKQNKKQIKCAEDVYNYFYPRFIDSDKENFIILNLDTKNKVINDKIISIGTLNSSVIHPREVFKSAIKESANSIIIVHNHPSGDSKPSKEDKKITEILFSSGEVLNIKVLDHIILGKNEWYSFRENS